MDCMLPKTGPANAAFGGQFVVRTENVAALDGTPPKRFVIIAFDSMDKAKAWDKSQCDTQEINEVSHIYRGRRTQLAYRTTLQAWLDSVTCPGSSHDAPEACIQPSWDASTKPFSAPDHPGPPRV